MHKTPFAEKSMLSVGLIFDFPLIGLIASIALNLTQNNFTNFVNYHPITNN